MDYLAAEYQPELEEKSSVSEPPMDPKKPGVPISYPLKTLKDLEDRSYFDSFHFPFNKSSVPLPPYRASKPLENRPRLLVCHDMKGGYVDDKWVQGNENSEAYAIWHWHLIDIFVYFSHDLVTLPPPCWTNTAHRHGVQVLGTFITEWDEGTSICKTLLASKESAEMYADRLTELAIELGFDGWLINMEVKLELEQITHMKEFVDHLTVSMHNSLPGSLVIWYDSVTKDGHLLWQNELNEKNKPFFDICDGILSTTLGRKIILNALLFLRANDSLMFTWVLMSLGGTHMVEVNGRLILHWRLQKKLKYQLQYLLQGGCIRPTKVQILRMQITDGGVLWDNHGLLLKPILNYSHSFLVLIRVMEREFT